jgi:hypothetical protein
VKLLTALESQFGKAQFIVTSGDNAYWNGNVDQLELGEFGFFFFVCVDAKASLCAVDKRRQKKTVQLFVCVFGGSNKVFGTESLNLPCLLAQA